MRPATLLVFHGVDGGGVGGRRAVGVAVLAGLGSEFPAFGGGDEPVGAGGGEVGFGAVPGVEEQRADRDGDVGGVEVGPDGVHHGDTAAHVVVVLGHGGGQDDAVGVGRGLGVVDRKSTRLNSSH